MSSISLPISIHPSLYRGRLLQQLRAHVSSHVHSPHPPTRPLQVLLPYSAGDLLDDMHRTGSVAGVEYRSDGSFVRGRVPLSLAGRLERFRVGGAGAEGAPAAAGLHLHQAGALSGGLYPPCCVLLPPGSPGPAPGPEVLHPATR